MCFTFDGDVDSGMFNWCITLLFIIFFSFSPLLRTVIGNKPQRRYYHSLGHNDKTWTSEAWAQHRPWPYVKKSTTGTAIRFFFGYTVYPLALPFSASFRLFGRQPEAARADTSRRRNDEKPRSIPERMEEERERSLGTRAYGSRSV